MDSRSRAPARRSSFVSALPSPYSRPSQFRHPGRSILFQTPPSNIGDRVAGESSAVNVVVPDQLAPKTMPDAPNTPGTVLPSPCSFVAQRILSFDMFFFKLDQSMLKLITEAPAQDGSDKETGQEPRYIVA